MRRSRSSKTAAIHRWAKLAIEVKELYLLSGVGQREHSIDLGGTTCDDQPTAATTSGDAGLDDDTRAGTVHQGELAQVKYDQA